MGQWPLDRPQSSSNHRSSVSPLSSSQSVIYLNLILLSPQAICPTDEEFGICLGYLFRRVKALWRWSNQQKDLTPWRKKLKRIWASKRKAALLKRVGILVTYSVHELFVFSCGKKKKSVIDEFFWWTVELLSSLDNTTFSTNFVYANFFS